MSKTFSHTDPFSGTSVDLNLEVPTNSAASSAADSSSLKHEISVGTQVALASLVWASAINVSAAINHHESIKDGLKSMRLSMIGKGVLPMGLYMGGPAQIAIAAQKKVLGQEENPSAQREALSALAGAGVEAAAGSPFDFLAIRQMLHGVKTSHHLQTNPADIAKFSQEELRRLIPTSAKTADKEAIIKSAVESKFSNISLTPQNLKMISEKIGVKLTVGDMAKSIAIMCPTSILRNLPFYVGLLEANKPKDQGDSHIHEAMLISLGGALMTSIPNNATYQSALRTIKGKEPSQAFTEALSESLQQVWKDPKKFTALVGIRAIATFSAVLCFSDGARSGIRNVVDGISDSMSQNLGFGDSLKLTAAEKDAVDKEIAVAITNSQEAEKPDAAPAKPQNTKLAIGTRENSK